MSQSPAVETVGLTKRYGEFTALNQVSISAEAGQILGFIGPNGAGKTTAIKILVGLLRPSEGTATIAGADCVRDARKIKRLVGYMPDIFGSYDNMRVTEYLDFFGAAYGIGRRDRSARIVEVLETTGSTYMQDRYVESLSHGMKQRIGIARTLLHDPQVLILDEPANGLDPQARIEMRELLLRLAGMGKTLIVTSHILPELARICDTVAIITKGKLRAFGTQADIMRKVTQRRTFESQLVDNSQVEAAKDLVDKLIKPVSEDLRSTASPTEGVVRFETDFSDRDLSGLLAQLLENGIAVAQFREVTTDLEDAFLSVTANDGDTVQAAAVAAGDGFEQGMNNPVIHREFLGALRTRKAIITLIVLTALFSLIVLFRWPTDGRVDLSGARSQQVFLVFAYGLLAGILFVVPAFPAVSFVQEKNRGTLALLINSPLSALSIYCGKLLGSLGFSALLLLTSLPAAGACYAMGGLELFGQIGMLLLVLCACTLQYTVIALFVSAQSQSSDAAVRVTYGVVFAVSVLAVGPYYLLQGQPGLLPSLSWWLRAASPLPVLMQLVGQGELGSLAIGQESTTTAYFTICILSSVVLGALTVGRLNHRLFDQAKSQGTITDELSLFVRVARRILYLVDPQRRKSGIPFYANPVMVKEFRTRKFGRIHWLLRLVSVCAVLSLLLTFFAATSIVDWGVETIGGFMVLLQIALVVLITPSLTSGLISAERESGGWELLRMTPMSPVKIVSGKLLSVIWTVALILLATVPGYVVMIYIKPTMWLQVQNVLICLGFAALYTVSIGALVGSLFRKTAAATTTCYAVLIVLFMGPLLIWMAQDAPFTHDFVEAALTINPTGAALGIIEFQLSDSKHFRTYELLPTAWWVASIVSAAALFCFGFQVWRIGRPS